MITEMLLNMLKTLFLSITSIIPAFSIPFDIVGGMAGFAELVNHAALFMPVTTLLIALGVWIAIQTTIFVISIINWVIRKIPTID